MVINPKQPWKQSRRPARMAQKPPEVPLVAPGAIKNTICLTTCIFLAVCLLAFKGCGVRPAQAATPAEPLRSFYSDREVVDAIGRAEDSKAFPYGVMTKYKFTTPRQACFNTVRHSKARWIRAGRPGDFIVWLGKTYSLPDVNPSWVRLVHWMLAHPKGMIVVRGGD